jgi:lipase ATG15
MHDTEDPCQEQDELETGDKMEDEESSETAEFGLTGMGESQGVFQVIETYRITRVSDRFCWIMFVAEIVLLFLWPLIVLFIVEDSAIGTVFLFVGLFSLLRYYLNAAVVLEEVGNFRCLQGKDDKDKWVNRSRTDEIVKNITRSRSRGRWIIVLGFFVVLAMVFGIGGLTQDDPQEGESYNITFVPAFRYEREQNSLPYPTCLLDFNAGGRVALGDFAFLSVMAYESNSTRLQKKLDDWFGSNVAIDMPDVVSHFRNQTNRELSPVTYKLYSFPNITSTGDPVAIVGVRGSQNAWDWLTNAQLWSGAYGMQILRSFLPFGLIWNPIFDELVKAISVVESESIKRVSYYKETSDFVRWLQSTGTYADVKITGHSLGGGLTIITAAQTEITGVAFSGPNAMMLRKALDPPITEEALDTFTFNVIPARDLVPTAGGKAKLYENIDCTAAPNDFSSCHDIVRSLCEILFTCGTGNRPDLCQCVTEYGYPEPISSNGDSFSEACGIE